MISQLKYQHLLEAIDALVNDKDEGDWRAKRNRLKELATRKQLNSLHEFANFFLLGESSGGIATSDSDFDAD